MKPLYTVPAAFAGLLFAPMAMADITAEDVWQQMVDMGEYMGQPISGTVAKSGNRLTISDLSYQVNTAEGGFSLGFGSMELIENGDGTVTIRYPQATTMRVEGDFAGQYPQSEPVKVQGTVDIALSNFDTVVSGDPTDMVYDFSAPELTVAVTNFNLIEPALPEDVDIDLALSAVMRDGVSKYVLKTGDAFSYDIDFSSSSLSMEISGSGLAEGKPFEGTASFNIADMVANYALKLANASDSPQMLDLMRAGAALSYGYEFGSGQVSIAGTLPEGSGQLDMSYQGGKSTTELADGVFTVAGDSGPFQAIVSSDAMPFPPLTIGIASSAIDGEIPLQPTDEDKAVEMKMALNGLSIDETLWNLFDPGAQLPRDPADLVIDLSGMGRWFVDITDPEVQANLDGIPGELSSVKINELTVAAAGAELNGTGAFEFDYDDLVTFDGMPKPTGQANLQLTGLNGLLDTLVNMGLLPQDQVLGARMMMGIFTTPGEGPDTLESELVVTEDGQVLANGQRLR